MEDAIVRATAVTMASVVTIAAAEAAPAVAAGSAEAATSVAVKYSNRASVQFTVGFVRDFTHALSRAMDYSLGSS